MQFVVKGRSHHASGYLPYIQYLEHLRTRMPPKKDHETFEEPYLGERTLHMKPTVVHTLMNWRVCVLSSHVLWAPMYIFRHVWAHQPWSNRKVSTKVIRLFFDLVPRLPFAVLGLLYILRGIQQSLPPVDSGGRSCAPTACSLFVGHDVRKKLQMV